MIDHITPIHVNDTNQPVPIWMLNQRINQINQAIDQIDRLIAWTTLGRDEATT